MYRHYNDYNSTLPNMNNNNSNCSDIEILELIYNFNEIKDHVNSIEEFLDKINNSYEACTPSVVYRIIEHTFSDTSLSLTPLFVRVSVNYCVVYKDKFVEVIESLNKILNKISNRLQTFREETIKCRENIAKCYEDIGDFSNAAVILSGTLIEENQRSMANDEKLNLNLKIAEYYLKCYSVKDAESYINRACQLLNEVNKDQCYIHYKRLYAEMLDMKQRFLEASQRFMELSLHQFITDNKEKEVYLIKATISAILTAASPSRFKLLSTLCKDERCKSLPTFSILEKMSLNRLVDESDFKGIMDLLLPYHKSELLLKKVMIESNISSISHVYSSISLESASQLLKISPNDTENFISSMISEDRLVGTIDQMSGYVRFPKYKSLASWDSKIEWICHSVNCIVEKIENAYPDWSPGKNDISRAKAEIN